MSRTAKIAAAILATSIAGVSGATVSSVILAYDAVFPRYNRPDYSVYPGQYCIERVPDLAGREQIWVQSGRAKLKTYIYRAKAPKGVIVFAHGIHAGADEYLPIFKYMVENGFTVIAHNTVGTYESSGNSTVGMCQSLKDIDRVIKHVKKDKEFKDLPLFTMGHSWGGYAASSVLALHSGITASALFAPMRNGATMMLEKGEQYVGKLAKVATPIFYSYQKVLFGKYTDYDAIRGINKSGIPVFIAQGIDDDIITFDGQSITAKMDEIKNPNVKYYFGRGVQGDHNNIWHSERAALYQMQLASDVKLAEMKKGKELTTEEKAELYKDVDHELYSELNMELMEQILDFFNDAIDKSQLPASK